MGNILRLGRGQINTFDSYLETKKIWILNVVILWMTFRVWYVTVARIKYVLHVNIEIHTCIVGAVIGCFKDSFPSDTVSTRGVQHDAEELFSIHSSCFHRSLTLLSDYNWSFYLISILDHECKSAGNEPGLHCSFCKNDTIVYGSVALLNNYFYSLSQFIHSTPVYSYLRGEVGCIKYGSWIFGKYVSIMLVWPLLQTLDISSLFNILRCRPRALNINDNFLAKYSIEWWLP